jgi:hypothetical protein
VDGRGGDPEIVGVAAVVEGVAGEPTFVAKLGNGTEQSVADGDDRGRLDRRLEPLSARLTPLCNECPVSEFADGDGCEEDLLSGHALDVGLEAGAATATQRSAEDARVDDEPHASSAAAIEGLAAPIVDRGGAWIGLAGCDLDVSERDTGVECGHDERCSQHVGMDVAEPASLADRTHPTMRCSPVETLPVTPAKNGPFMAFAHGQVDRSRSPRYERDGCGLVAFAEDLQCAVSSLEPEILDVGCAGFAGVLGRSGAKNRSSSPCTRGRLWKS